MQDILAHTIGYAMFIIFFILLIGFAENLIRLIIDDFKSIF